MEKVDEIDLNGNSVTEDNGQPETEVKEEESTEAVIETKVEEETVESLKARLEKSEREKENYKKGMLKAKGKTLEPTKEEETTEEIEEYPEWDENSKKFQEQTEKKAAIIATETARKAVEKSNENTAIANFISQHPELGEDSKWNEVISNYHPKNGKETIQSIEKDLERAYVVTKFENGELSSLEKEAFKKGKATSEVEELSSVQKTTSKTVKDDGKTVSEGALRLAQAMRVDPKKLAEEDDSNFAEIQL